MRFEAKNNLYIITTLLIFRFETVMTAATCPWDILIETHGLLQEYLTHLKAETQAGQLAGKDGRTKATPAGF